MIIIIKGKIYKQFSINNCLVLNQHYKILFYFYIFFKSINCFTLRIINFKSKSKKFTFYIISFLKVSIKMLQIENV